MSEDLHTVADDGSYPRPDGSTVELKAGQQISHDEAVELGLLPEDEADADETTPETRELGNAPENRAR